MAQPLPVSATFHFLIHPQKEAATSLLARQVGRAPPAAPSPTGGAFPKPTGSLGLEKFQNPSWLQDGPGLQRGGSTRWSFQTSACDPFMSHKIHVVGGDQDFFFPLTKQKRGEENQVSCRFPHSQGDRGLRGQRAWSPALASVLPPTRHPHPASKQLQTDDII